MHCADHQPALFTETSKKLSNFPAELRERRIWCLWRYEERDGKRTKVLYQLTDPTNAKPAKSNDAATWATFADICAALDGEDAGSEWGIGLFCDGTFTFIDVDHCRDPLTGELHPQAQEIVSCVNSYAELSPSETGLHIFATGTISAAIKRNGVEMYCERRFATVTGKWHSGAFRAFAGLEDLRADVDAGRVSLIPPAPAAPVAGPITAIRKGLTFDELEAGRSPGDDASKGDFQYVATLADQGLTDAEIAIF